MAADPSEARLRYLKEAVFHLAIPAPTVSASLSSTYTKSMMDTEDDPQRAKKKWDTLRRDFCVACGAVMLAGWSSSVHIRPDPIAAKKRSDKRAISSKNQIVSVCLRCDRKYVQNLEPRKPKHVNSDIRHKDREAATAAELPSKHIANDLEKVTKSANATSKQRKKARKGGLQAMLEKSKSQNSGGGLGLDLMDFMQ